jgi:general secretion pathway protein L
VSDLVGVVLREDRVDVVAIRRRPGRSRLLDAFSLEVAEGAGAALRARLRERGIRARRAHIGLARRLATVKAIELPAVAGADLRRMVGFELERHLPFPVAEAIFDFDVLERVPGRPARVLLVAAERRIWERARQLSREAGLVPRVLDVAVHAIARLASRGRPVGAGDAVAWLDPEEGELAITSRGRVVASRAFPLPAAAEARGAALGREVERTLGALAPPDAAGVADILITGQGLADLEVAGLPVRREAPMPPGPGLEAASLPALAMALEPTGRWAPRLNLLPDELRPRPFPWPVAATAALALATLAVGAAIPVVTLLRDRATLADLDAQVARVAPDVAHVERLAAEIERARREVDSLRSFEREGVRALPVLRELTELLPADVWLTTLSADRTGVELGGFAGSASQLIPLLEGSSRLERVEFTSPVTKGRDREQFRLRAAWERPAGAR